MYWQGVMIPMLRILIDDNPYSGTYVYKDTRLTETLVVAAMFVTQEITFNNSYTIDVINSSITPDPYELNDKLFMNMVVLKAACIIDIGHLRQKALLSGLEAKCGPATMRTLQHLDGFKQIIELGPCKIYEKLKEENAFSGEALNSLIHFVLSPFVGNDFDPVNALQRYYDTERMIR